MVSSIIDKTISSTMSSRANSTSCHCPKQPGDITLDDIAVVVAGLNHKVLQLRKDILSLKESNTIIQPPDDNPLGSEDKEEQPSHLKGVLKKQKYHTGTQNKHNPQDKIVDTITNSDSSESEQGQRAAVKSNRNSLGKFQKKTANDVSHFQNEPDSSIVNAQNQTSNSKKHQKQKTIKLSKKERKLSRGKKEIIDTSYDTTTSSVDSVPDAVPKQARSDGVKKNAAVQNSIELTKPTSCKPLGDEKDRPYRRRVKRISRGVQYVPPEQTLSQPKRVRRKLLNFFKLNFGSKKEKKRSVSKRTRSTEILTNRNSVEVIFKPETEVTEKNNKDRSRPKEMKSAENNSDISSTDPNQNPKKKTSRMRSSCCSKQEKDISQPTGRRTCCSRNNRDKSQLTERKSSDKSVHEESVKKIRKGIKKRGASPQNINRDGDTALNSSGTVVNHKPEENKKSNIRGRSRRNNENTSPTLIKSTDTTSTGDGSTELIYRQRNNNLKQREGNINDNSPPRRMAGRRKRIRENHSPGSKKSKEFVSDDDSSSEVYRPTKNRNIKQMESKPILDDSGTTEDYKTAKNDNSKRRESNRKDCYLSRRRSGKSRPKKEASISASKKTTASVSHDSSSMEVYTPAKNKKSNQREGEWRNNYSPSRMSGGAERYNSLTTPSDERSSTTSHEMTSLESQRTSIRTNMNANVTGRPVPAVRMIHQDSARTPSKDSKVPRSKSALKNFADGIFKSQPLQRQHHQQWRNRPRSGSISKHLEEQRSDVVNVKRRLDACLIELNDIIYDVSMVFQEAEVPRGPAGEGVLMANRNASEEQMRFR